MGGTKLRLDNGCIVGLVADSVERRAGADVGLRHAPHDEGQQRRPVQFYEHFTLRRSGQQTPLQPRPLPTQDRTQLLTKTVTLGPLNVTVNATVEQEVLLFSLISVRFKLMHNDIKGTAEN